MQLDITYMQSELLLSTLPLQSLPIPYSSKLLLLYKCISRPTMRNRHPRVPELQAGRARDTPMGFPPSPRIISVITCCHPYAV